MTRWQREHQKTLPAMTTVQHAHAFASGGAGAGAAEELVAVKDAADDDGGREGGQGEKRGDEVKKEDEPSKGGSRPKKPRAKEQELRRHF